MESGGVANFNGFKDILEERHGSSDFLFMSRKWEPAPAYLQTCKCSPSKIKEDVLASERIQHMIREISDETGTPKEVLKSNVREILNEIGLSRNTGVIRWLGIFLLKILKRICSGLYVNEQKLLKIKSEMGKTPLIFAPSHRSYADFILMSYLCFHYEIQIPAIAAGMDFHSMWIMGHLLRESCAFFMRRSFNNDRLYWTTFSEYVFKIVTENESSIEFFIEGTRSRSGKSLVPKFGLLSMTLTPFFCGHVPDVVIVPVNISYDRVLEERLFAYELLGVPKPKESTKGFLKAMSILKEHYGKVYMDFAEPISVHEYFGSALNRAVHSMVPRHIDCISPYETSLCIDLSYHIVSQQQKHSTLVPFNLISVILAQNNGAGASLDIVIEEVTWLKTVFQFLGSHIDLPEDSSGIRESVINSISVHRSLATITSSGVVQLTKFTSLQCTKDISKVKGHNLLQETMDLAVPLVMLQIYINPCLHYIINHALIAVSVKTFSQLQEINEDELFEKYHYLRMLLSYEFVLHNSWEEKDFKISLRELTELDVIRNNSPRVLVIGSNQKLMSLLCWVLQPFITTYYVVSQVLKKVAVNPVYEREILQATQQRVEQLLIRKEICHAYTLSLDTHSSCLQALISLGALIKSKTNCEVKYRAVDSKLDEVIRNLGVFRWQQQNSVLNLGKQFTKQIMVAGTRSKL